MRDFLESLSLQNLADTLTGDMEFQPNVLKTGCRASGCHLNDGGVSVDIARHNLQPLLYHRAFHADKKEPA